MSKLHGHSMPWVHLLGELAIFGEIIHYEIVSEAIYGHKYHSFSLACMLTSRPYKTNCMLIIGL